MIKPLLGAAFAIALTGTLAALGQSGGSSPAVVASVSVAPLSPSEASQAKLSPLDPNALAVSIESLTDTTGKFTPIDGLSTHTTPTFASDVQDQVESFVSQLTQDGQTGTLPNPSATSSTSSFASIPNVAAATFMAPNGPSNISVVTNPSTASQAISSFNTAQSKIAALDVPVEIKAQLFQLLQLLQTQLFATTLSSNTSQTTASSNTTVAAVNSFLKNVNTLNASAGDKAKAFAALLPSFTGIPGVNLNYAITTPAVTPLTTAPTAAEIMTQTQSQIQAITAFGQANLDAQRKYVESLPSEGSSRINTEDYLNAALGSMYGYYLAH